MSLKFCVLIQHLHKCSKLFFHSAVALAVSLWENVYLGSLPFQCQVMVVFISLR